MKRFILHIKKYYLKIQNQLFNLGSCIAFDQKKDAIKLENIKKEDVQIIENEIDKMNASLPTLKNFILPSGLSTVSKCHIARTVCRRAERNLITLAEVEKTNPLHIKYLNRLSDYLFVLARYILMENKIDDVKWEKNDKLIVNSIKNILLQKYLN